MKTKKIYSVLFCSLLFSTLSCIREEPVIMEEEDGLVRVPVGLNLSVEALLDGTPETKATMDPDLDGGMTDDAQIKNIVVLQFNGITSEARLVGGQAYFDHWPLHGYNPSDPLYDVNDKLTLVASATANTVVVLANTFDRISITSGTTLGQFLAQDYTTISGLSGVLITSGGNDYFRLSGSQKLDNISGVTNVNIALKRNVAKIVVNVTNNTSGNTGDNVVTISKVQLREINAKYYYLAHIGAGLDPSVVFSDSYSEAYPYRFDNGQEDFAAAGNTGTTQTYSYYVPANLRGVTTNAQQYSKSQGAPKGATRFCIYGTYGTSNSPINYTYFLGENLTNNFNIQPNYKYTYNITINSKGNPNYDYRIEDMGEVQFSTDANCYMLHPPTVSGQSRVYAIPVRRAAVFWNEPGHESGVGEYGARIFEGNVYWNNQLLADSQWNAEVLWSDFDMTRYVDPEADGYVGDADKFLQVASGRGFAPGHSQPYFKVKIHNGMTGNVVVGIKKQGGSDILWSWHLWITDYNPDKNVVPADGKYIYGVDNGEIHRYKSGTAVAPGIWETTATQSTVGYANGFAMDRNLGSYSAVPDEDNAISSYGLEYEYGKKDPYVVYNKNLVNNHFYLGGTVDEVVIDNAHRYSNSDKDIRYAVTHPMVKINGYNWTTNNDDLGDGGNVNYRWNDRKIESHTGNQAMLELKKSIYDPCPPGWKIPSNWCYNGFVFLNDDNSASQTYTVEYKNYGIYYYPEGYIERERTGSIYFPKVPYRIFYNWNFYSDTAHYWIDSNSWVLLFSNSGVQKSSIYRGCALPIRCVRE